VIGCSYFCNVDFRTLRNAQTGDGSLTFGSDWLSGCELDFCDKDDDECSQQSLDEKNFAPKRPNLLYKENQNNNRGGKVTFPWVERVDKLRLLGSGPLNPGPSLLFWTKRTLKSTTKLHLLHCFSVTNPQRFCSCLCQRWHVFSVHCGGLGRSQPQGVREFKRHKLTN